VTPHASVTDGLLDLCIVEAMGRGDFARLLLKVKRGEHLGEAGVHYAQLPWVTIESPQQLSVNVDGETSDARKLDYVSRAHDLWVHVVHPPGAEDELRPSDYA
jgi:diacylglycerol kinase family enzyme